MNNMRFRFRRGDLLAIAAVAVIAVAVALAFLPRSGADQNAAVRIYQDGQLIRELSLQAEETIQITGSYTNTVTVQNGKVAITHSDCPGTDCVHSGWISSPGRSIVCLPNRVEVRITGTADVDFIVG